MHNPENINNEESAPVDSFESAKEYLFTRLMDPDNKLYGREKGILRTEAWLNNLGNPQEAYPSIHIAGTSGKGSTAYILTTLLNALGQNTGTITSPHIYDVRERLLINGNHIPETEFLELTKQLIPIIDSLGKTPLGRPTYFEVMLGMAHKCFKNNAIDFGVIETGIGGQYDSTNTIKRNDKLAIITRLGLDHTELLGNSMEKIARQKSGIIPYNGHALAIKPNELLVQKILQSTAKKRNSTIEFIDPSASINNISQTIDGLTFDYSASNSYKNLSLPTLGVYQAENVALAISAIEYLSKRNKLNLNAKSIQKGLINVEIPARAQIFDINNTPVIIDSAHNPQKLKAFFGLIKSLNLPIKPIVIYGAKQNKDWQTSLPIIYENADKVLVTSFFANQPGHLQKYSADAKLITKNINSHGGNSIAFTSPADALNFALQIVNKSQPIIITGSMYMLGELHDQPVSIT